jgi:hypothetical protein
MRRDAALCNRGKQPTMFRTAVRACALATTVVLATAMPAHAAKVVLKDATGDVWTGDETPVEAGSKVNGDLKKTVITHSSKKIVVKATYTDLAKNSDMLMFGAYLRTNEGLKRGVFLTAAPGSRKGEVEFSKGSNEAKASCAHLTHAIDYVANTITISVPRNCVSSPRWVQVQPGALTMAFESETMGMTIDDALSAGPEPKTWSPKVKVG